MLSYPEELCVAFGEIKEREGYCEIEYIRLLYSGSPSARGMFQRVHCGTGIEQWSTRRQWSTHRYERADRDAGAEWVGCARALESGPSHRHKARWLYQAD